MVEEAAVRRANFNRASAEHANYGSAVVPEASGMGREAPVTGVEARGRGYARDGIKARASTAVSTPHSPLAS